MLEQSLIEHLTSIHIELTDQLKKKLEDEDVKDLKTLKCCTQKILAKLGFKLGQQALILNSFKQESQNKSMTHNIQETDITNEICTSIQRFVQQNFISPNSDKTDLLQDEIKIKAVFNEKNDIVSQLFQKIGKIQVRTSSSSVSSVIKNDQYVVKLFDFYSNQTMVSCFHEYFAAMFHDPPAMYLSEIECIQHNSQLYQNPIRLYLQASRYTYLRILCDKSQNDSESTSQNKTTNNALQCLPAFKGMNLAKYKSFGSLRPDSRLQDEHGRIFERVEVKAKSQDIPIAECELVEKCFRLNRYQYGDIKIQYGLVIGANQVNLYLINFKPKCEINCNDSACRHPKIMKTNKECLTLLREFNLTYVADRISLFFNVMVIAEICEKIRQQCPCLKEFHRFKFQETLTRTRNDMTYATINFSYLLDMVEKEVTNLKEISSTILLENFYKHIDIRCDPSNGTRPVTDTVKATYYRASRNKFSVRVTPIGYNSNYLIAKVNESVKELKKAIICVMEAALSMHANGFVHRDIRWDNITYDSEKQTYLLFDFEQIGKLCDWNCKDKDHRRFNCSPAIVDAAYIIKLFDHSDLRNTETVYEYVEFAKKLDFESIKAIAEDFCNVGKETTLTNKQTKGKKKNKKNADMTIKKIMELFWNFYDENIKDFKPQLDKRDLDKRKNESTF